MLIKSRPNGFTRQDRLLRPQHYRAVFLKPVKSADSAYTVLARPNQCYRPRLGVIVSKKNVPGAARRNRLKRLVRESFRTHKHIIKAHDVIVICKPYSARVINKKLFKYLRKHWAFLQNHAGQDFYSDN